MIFKINRESAAVSNNMRFSIDKIIDNVGLENPKFAEELRNNKGEVSDGYHTFNDLYHHRALLFATICNLYPDLAWKSKNHHDPKYPMYDGMFICGIQTPDGQATYHYDIDPYWDMFHVKELDKAPEFDGHTPSQAVERIYNLSNKV